MIATPVEFNKDKSKLKYDGNRVVFSLTDTDEESLKIISKKLKENKSVTNLSIDNNFLSYWTPEMMNPVELFKDLFGDESFDTGFRIVNAKYVIYDEILRDTRRVPEQ